MVEELFGGAGSKLNTKSGAQVDVADAFKDAKVVGIYFSMHNCPPCRQFTPVFAEIYNELAQETGGSKTFEVVFCSGDKTEKEYNEYYGEMPWISLPWQDSRLAGLAKKFEVRGVPRLIVVKRDGTVLEQNAVQKLMMEGPDKAREYLAQA